MARLFYEKFVPADDLLVPLFGGSMSADHPQRVAKWLGEVFGGDKCYSEAYGGYARMLGEHLNKCLTEEMRARWVLLLLQSAREAGLPNDAVRSAQPDKAWRDWAHGGPGILPRPYSRQERRSCTNHRQRQGRDHWRGRAGRDA